MHTSLESLTSCDTSVTRKNQKGFTLIEVLLTVMIISILSVAGFSSIIQIQKGAKVREIRGRVMNIINLARSYALNGKTQESCSFLEKDDNGILAPAKDSQGSLIPGVPEHYDIRISSSVIRVLAKGAGCGPDTSAADAKKFPGLQDDRHLYTIDDPRYEFQINGQSIANTTPELQYFTPLGNFATSGIVANPSAPSTITIDIYDKNAKAVPQKITLYATIGIPE
jgi:prepilin-type N-terminal cleavage/methylation domain-containing protein